MDMWSLVRMGFMQNPGGVAVIHGDTKVTYRELEKRIDKFANVLNGLGLEKGDRVSVVGENCLTVLEAQYAILKSGMVWVPLNFRNHPNEHVHYLNNAGSKALVMQNQFAEGIESVKDRIETVEHFIVDGEGYQGMERYDDLMDKASDKPFRVDVDAEDMMAIMHTSGTTGAAKGVVHTHMNWMMMTLMAVAEMDIRTTDTAMYIAPINHGSGILIPPHFMRGVPNILVSHLDIDFVLDTIQKEKVTTIWLAPTIIYFLLAFPNLSNYDISSLRTCPYSSAPMAVEKLKEAVDVFGQVFLQAYGLVECPIVTWLSKQEHTVDGTEDQTRRLGSAGRQALMTEMLVVDGDGNELPAGEVGEIIVRSPLVMKEYWKNPEATAQAIRDGWFYTGDLGYIDDGGYLFVADRMKDMIITGGYNVYPKEVENVIFKNDAVFETAVIGVPDEVWGESVKAFVVKKPGMDVTEEEIIELCKDNLASYKKPKSVELVDALPKNLAGKILKNELRAPYWEGQERQVH